MTATTQLEALEMDDTHRDLESASRVRGAPVSQLDLADLLDALAAADVEPPAAAVRALELLAEVDAYYARPRLVGGVLPEDLDTITGEELVELVRVTLLDHFLATRLGDNLRHPLTKRAVAALSADYGRIITELAVPFAAAACTVHTAAAAGIRPSMTAEQVISLGDEAVAAWRELRDALLALDGLNLLANRVAAMCGWWPPPGGVTTSGPATWLPRALTGPPELPADLARRMTAATEEEAIDQPEDR